MRRFWRLIIENRGDVVTLVIVAALIGLMSFQMWLNFQKVNQ